MCWLVAEFMTGSAVTATVVLRAIAGLGVAGVAGVRAMGMALSARIANAGLS